MANPEKVQDVDVSQYFNSNPNPIRLLELFIAFAPDADIFDRRLDITRKTVLPESSFDTVNPDKLFEAISIAMLKAPFLRMFIDQGAGKMSKEGMKALQRLRQQTDAQAARLPLRVSRCLKEEGIRALIEANIAIRMAAKAF